MSDPRRQQGDQIREVLSQLKALQVEEEAYLKLEDVLDATKGILYPEGVETQEQYERLMAISKGGCKAIGYSDQEVTLSPPVVSFSERGTYLKKRGSPTGSQMPIITDQIITTLIDELIENNYDYINKPVIAIKREKLPKAIAYKQSLAWDDLVKAEREFLIQRGDEVAKKLGFCIEQFSDPPWLAGETFYAKPMTPDFTAWRKAVSQQITSKAYPKVDIVKVIGLHAAFNNRVNTDPENIISEDHWHDLFDQLGYVYDKEQNQLTPKLINFEDSTIVALARAISEIPTYKHPKIGPFLIKDDLTAAAKAILGETITKGRLDRLIQDGLIGQILIKLGYQITTCWFSRYEFKQSLVPSPEEPNGRVFTRAIQVDHNSQTPELASGFRIYSPVLVRDEETLVYMELLGPRQAVKANWAALRQRNRSHYLRGVLCVQKEDKLTTLKTTLPCGWDHWCLIHRQASYQKLTPNQAFYLIAQKEEAVPATFITFLAKSLAIPIYAQWAEYLWVEGRMKELISPLSEGCYGFGGWKVQTHEWDKIVSEGLAEGHISF